MKRASIVGISAIALMSAAALVGVPLAANLGLTQTALAQNVQPKSKVNLGLTAQKRIAQKDA